MILAGDVGGTKADLALFDPDGGPRRPQREARFSTREHGSLQNIIERFLDDASTRPRRAVLGIAGPVVDNRCETTNLPWHVDGDAVGRSLGFEVTLVNDLTGTAWGVALLETGDVEVLNPGSPGKGSRVLVAAGTGLGESILARDGDRWLVVPSEGGHTDFAPRNALEDELLVWLRARHRRVSYERILSGPGLADLYRFLTETGRGDEPDSVARRFAGAPDPAVVVTETALDGSCERARLAVERFVEVYGAEAGNLALKAFATGGVYLAGGIAPRLTRFLRDPRFLAAFADKGRLSPAVAAMPVAVILDARTGLYGAALYALTQP